MDIYGTLEALLEYSPPEIADYPPLVEIPDDENLSTSLDALLGDKVTCLSNILAQIERDIHSREALSDQLFHHIEQHYCYLKTKLFELYTWTMGRNRSIEGRRSSLEKQLDALHQEKRLEQVKSWQDIESLKKEWRNWFKQYCDVVQRAKIILSDNVSRK